MLTNTHNLLYKARVGLILPVLSNLAARNERILLVSLYKWMDFAHKQIRRDLTQKYIKKDITTELTDWEFIEEQGTKIIKPAALKIMQTGGNQAYRVLQAQLAFDVLNVEAVRAADKFCANLVREVTGQTRKGVRNHISAGIKAGKSMNKIARELKPLVGLTSRQIESIGNYRNFLNEKRPELSTAQVDKRVTTYSNRTNRRRMQTIARTETARAQNIGYVVGLEDLGIEEVEFQISPDACEEWCVPLNETKYKLDEGKGIIPVHPNCRCVMLPVIADIPTCRMAKGMAKAECILPDDLHDKQIDDLLTRLKTSDPSEGRKIRSALRRLGHKGGLGGKPPVTTIPRVKPTVPTVPKPKLKPTVPEPTPRFIKSPEEVSSIDDLLNYGKLPVDDIQYDYYFHAAKHKEDINSILKYGLDPRKSKYQDKVFWGTKDAVRERGSGGVIFRTPKGAGKVGWDVVDGVKLKEYTFTTKVPVKDILKPIRIVVDKTGYAIREDALASFAAKNQESTYKRIKDLPEKYQRWFDLKLKLVKPVIPKLPISKPISVKVMDTKGSGLPLKDYEIKAIGDYQSGFYDQIRQFQLGQKLPSDVTRAVKEQIKNMESGLLKLPGRTGTTYRGLEFENQAQRKKFLEQFKEKGIWKSKTFQSTSIDRKIAEQYALAMEDDVGSVMIKIKGVSGREISKIEGVFTGMEEEILFRPGTSFRVDKVFKNAVYLTEVTL